VRGGVAATHKFIPGLSNALCRAKAVIFSAVGEEITAQSGKIEFTLLEDAFF
jgi:hypothetical protein